MVRSKPLMPSPLGMRNSPRCQTLTCHEENSDPCEGHPGHVFSRSTHYRVNSPATDTANSAALAGRTVRRFVS
jgi:hypothetical protein